MMTEYYLYLNFVTKYLLSHGFDDVEELDLEGVLGGIFSGYTLLSHGFDVLL